MGTITPSHQLYNNFYSDKELVIDTIFPLIYKNTSINELNANLKQYKIKFHNYDELNDVYGMSRCPKLDANDGFIDIPYENYHIKNKNMMFDAILHEMIHQLQYNENPIQFLHWRDAISWVRMSLSKNIQLHEYFWDIISIDEIMAYAYSCAIQELRYHTTNDKCLSYFSDKLPKDALKLLQESTICPFKNIDDISIDYDYNNHVCNVWYDRFITYIQNIQSPFSPIDK